MPSAAHRHSRRRRLAQAIQSQVPSRDPSEVPPSLPERNQKADLVLATRYDALNQSFSEVERILKALKPVHAVWVDYNHSTQDGTQPDQWELLGLEKFQTHWRLCHAVGNDFGDFGAENIKPIVECPIEQRVRAARMVNDLHEAIVKSKEDYVAKVDDAIKELQSLIETKGKGVPQ